MLGRNLIQAYVMSGAFLLSVPKFRETSKISYLLTSGERDIKLICLLNCISVNKGVHKEQNEWSFVKLFHIFPELLHFTFPLPLNMASEFRHTDQLSNTIFYHLAVDPSLASRFFCYQGHISFKKTQWLQLPPDGTSESNLMVQLMDYKGCLLVRPPMLSAKSSENLLSRLKLGKFWRFWGSEGQGF